MQEQPDEEHAFGPAALLVAEWQRLRMAGEGSGSRVDRAMAAVQRWGLEAEMLREFHVTPPPEAETLDESRLNDYVRRREWALAEARRELGREKRAPMFQ